MTMVARRTACLTLLLALAPCPVLAATPVKAARVGLTPERARLVLESAAPLDYQLFALDNPPRLVLDLQGVPLDAVLRGLPAKLDPGHPYLDGIRVGRPCSDVARVVFDLKTAVAPRHFRMAPDGEHEHRLVLDVRPALSAATPAAARPPPDVKPVSAARVGLIPGRTRIVVESDKPIDYRLFSLDEPARLVLDLQDVPLDAVLRGLPAKIGPHHPYLKAIRVGRPFGEVARVVLDLKAPVDPLTFRLDPMDGHGYRLVLDVHAVSAGPAPASAPRLPAELDAPAAPVPAAVEPPASPPPAAAAEPMLLLLEVRLDRHVLSGAIPAYEIGDRTLLPLGELARLLTLAIQTEPGEGTASGFILSENRGFSLNVPQARATVAGGTESFDPSLAMAEPDDLYVAAELLERWLPLQLEINRSSLVLEVRPREQLPLQARLAREQSAERLGSRPGERDPGYPRHESPYRLLGLPFIDQTLGLELRDSDAGTQTRARYTGYLTADFLGMESALFIGADTDGSSADPNPELRFTLGRHDPDASLLGPLRARAWQVGSLTSPSVPNLARGETGNGITLSNRPLTQPTSFDRQTFEGDLPPGWDVELYYNDALVDFQAAGPDGRYRFEDQPLLYGRNDFRLVFHGPLGQLRVERHSFSLGTQMTRPGEFYYSLTEHRDDDGQARSVAQFDWGLSRNLAATGGLVRLPVDGLEQRYASLGLRSFWGALILSGDFTRAEDGGSLAELGLKTGWGGVSVDARHLQLDAFVSDEFSPSSDPVRLRDELRVSGAIPLSARRRLPVSLTVSRDQRESGADSLEAAGRISAYVNRTFFTQTLDWRSLNGTESLNGGLRISRRLGGLGLAGDIGYTLTPETELSVAAVSADKALGEGYRLNLGLAHAFATPRTLYTAGLSKSLGRFGLSLNASYSSDDELAVGAQLFVAAGREPRRAEWMTDALPMANMGAASARVFLDANGNGALDAGEEAVAGAGFTVNGSQQPARTDEDGIAYLGRLPARQHVDIGLDTATLADPQWSPRLAGLRLVPRPGNVAELEFPVMLTSEIDGTVYLVDTSGERGIGDMTLELLDRKGKVIAEAKSAWDGFYIVEAVPPGSYRLRISPEQLRRLKLTATGERSVTVSPTGEFVNGIDFTVKPVP